MHLGAGIRQKRQIKQKKQVAKDFSVGKLDISRVIIRDITSDYQHLLV